MSTAPLSSDSTLEYKSAESLSDPLHGMTLEAIVTALVSQYGWDDLGQRIPIRCFQSEPSVASSLKFLRKTPWARGKVEGLYLFMLREFRRAAPTAHNFPPSKAKAPIDPKHSRL